MTLHCSMPCCFHTAGSLLRIKCRRYYYCLVPSYGLMGNMMMMTTVWFPANLAAAATDHPTYAPPVKCLAT
jgi:hypothetical protein